MCYQLEVFQSRMDEEGGGPLQSALMAHSKREPTTISDDQIRQLLIFMGTITVISFVLVIALVTIFIAFIWYSRTRLHRSCGCNHDHDKQRRSQETQGHKDEGFQIPRASLGQPVKMFVVHPGQFQLRGTHKNVIVNSGYGPGTHLAQALARDLVPSINQSGGGPMEGQIYSGQDELGQIESGHESCSNMEPIYAEIQPRTHESDGKKGSQGTLEESATKANKIVERDEDMNKKKEIEYWQITAKEVVRFRPCTETFIQRE